LHQGVDHGLGNPLAVEIDHVIGAEGVGFAGAFDKTQDDVIRHAGLGQLDDFLQVRGQIGRG
jgi:hypothetical protein